MPFGGTPGIPIIPGGIIGRCVIPNPLVRATLPGLGIPLMKPLAELTDRAASLEPVELAGLSMSIPPADSLVPALLLLRRCRLEDPDVPTLRVTAAAPGPGVFFGGAAAIGITPFPPTAPLADPA